jgi:hypothetical protein
MKNFMQAKFGMDVEMRFPIALFIFLKKLPSIQFSEINIPA